MGSKSRRVSSKVAAMASNLSSRSSDRLGPRPLRVGVTREDHGEYFMEQHVASACLHSTGAALDNLYEAVHSFELLSGLGIYASLVDACRRCAGADGEGAVKVRPTAIQAECWGLLLLPLDHDVAAPSTFVAPGPLPIFNENLCAPAVSSSLAAEAIPVPSDDSDLDNVEEDVEQVNTSGCCRVRETHDVIGIAPTGSGKTLAYLVPLLADGLCDRGRCHTSTSVFNRFVELFSLSYPLTSAGNAAVLDRCKKVHASEKTTELVQTVAQIAQRTANSCVTDRNLELAVRWQALRSDCDSVTMVSPQALVLAPTREIAWQVATVAKDLGASCCPVVGGVDPERQREHLSAEAPALIVATPGRLRALCGQVPSSTRRRAEANGMQSPAPPDELILLSGVRRLVLDEGDRLLDEGFDEDIQSLACLATHRRHSMVFSATWSTETESLAKVLRQLTVHITVAGVPTNIAQTIELVPKAARGRRLRKLLSEFGQAKVLVFVLFKQEAKALAKMLESEGYTAFAMQGNMTQSARAKTMQSFRDAPFGVLVATDLAARGLDVQGVTHVVNFSLGLSIDSYVHRIGRCGRAGRKGIAVSFVTDGDERHAYALLKMIQQARQPVPPGLQQMATSYECSHMSAGFSGMKLKNTQSGEVRAVARFGPKACDSDEEVNKSSQKVQNLKIWKGARRKPGAAVDLQQ